MKVERIKPVPWITYKAKEWLDSYLKDEMQVFEWGSGGSTLYFSGKVKDVVSVEHDKNWYKEIIDIISKQKIKNCEYKLIKPSGKLLKDKPFYEPQTYTSIIFRRYWGMSFEKYVNVICNYRDKSFDLILIDGRARASCIYKAINKVKRKGYVILDNSERKEYNEAKSLLNNYNKKAFYGSGPYVKSNWETTIWEIG